MLVVSLALVFTAGCHRDPNVRKQKYLESGKTYEASGKYKEASIQFLNAIKLDRSFAPAYYQLALTYLKMDSLQQAYGALLKTVDLDPQNVDAHITLGNIYLEVHAIPKAEIQARDILAINPNNADAYALLAGVAQGKNDTAEAIKNIQRALQIEPNRASFHSALAVLEEKDPNTEASAEQELAKAASLDPKSPTPHLYLAGLLEKKGDHQGAEQQLLAAIGADPKNLQARGALVSLYIRTGDNAKAEQTLLQTVNDLPDNQGAATLLAEYYIKAGQLDHAAQVFQGLDSKYPKSFAIKLTYARILFEKKDYTQANSLATQLTKTDAGNPDVQLLDAMLLLNTGKIDDAFTLLKKAVKDNPNSIQTQLLLARVASAKGDTTTAEASYRQAAMINPGSIEAQNGLADIAIRRGDVGMLSEVADKTIQLHPDFALAYLWRGTAEAGRKEYDKAEADFQAVLKSNPNNSTVYVELAQLRYVQGHIPEGNAMLEKALEKDPNSSVALNGLAAYDLLAKQPAKAIARVQAQIAKEPGNGDFYAELGYLQLKTQDFKDAADTESKAMQLNPASLQATQVYTQAEVALGQVDAALATWQNWTNAHPSDANAIMLLGTLEEAKGNDGKAEVDYKKALQLDPNNGSAANNLAYMMVEDDENLDVALSLAQTARRVLPDRPETADTLAWVYYHKEDYRAARDLLQEALKTFPNDAPVNLHLGMTDAMLNDKGEAQAYLKKAISLAPNSKTGKTAADELAKLGQ
ncbi:MAG: tetratricopeptide repeat protein [Acidobacteriaceae bacterium]|jgi:tetratricopeptide (TPR) repeat protein